ncbi:hypothetical protein [Glycomyces sp. NPDC047010]|uniref:hypothetical protein n=1 Tax=Glycomyces sp. NPDC047010 TaxID=3155023 RepID=UPI0033EF05FE
MTVAKSGTHAGDMIALDHLAWLWPDLGRHMVAFPPSRKAWRVVSAVGGTTSVLLAAALLLPGFDRGADEPEDPESTESTLLEATDTEGVSPAAGESPDFLATITQLNNVCARVDFAEGMEATATPFLDTEQVYSTDEDVYIGDALNAGAYATGSLVIEFTLQTELDHMVTIYDIRANVAEAEPLPMQSHLGLETCGGGEVDAMAIPLGQADHGPFVRDEYGEMTGEKFFDTRTIDVSPTEKPYVLVEVFTTEDGYSLDTATAYEFTLEIEYESGGVKGTQVIDLNDAPFRLSTGQVCYDQVVGYGGMTGFNEDPTLARLEILECVNRDG